MSSFNAICIVEDTRESEDNYNSLVNSALVSLNRFPINKYLKSTKNTLNREYAEYDIKFNWPKNKDHHDIEMGFTRRVLDQNYSDMQCRAMTHYRLWDYCIETNRPLLILEPSVRFYKPFNYDDYKDLEQDIFTINNPKFCIENWEIITRFIIKHKGPIAPIPSYKEATEIQTTPDAISYIITPSGATRLILNVDDYGLWPVEMMLNRQCNSKFIGMTNKFYTRKVIL